MFHVPIKKKRKMDSRRGCIIFLIWFRLKWFGNQMAKSLKIHGIVSKQYWWQKVRQIIFIPNKEPFIYFFLLSLSKKKKIFINSTVNAPSHWQETNISGFMKISHLMDSSQNWRQSSQNYLDFFLVHIHCLVSRPNIQSVSVKATCFSQTSPM